MIKQEKKILLSPVQFSILIHFIFTFGFYILIWGFKNKQTNDKNQIPIQVEIKEIVQQVQPKEVPKVATLAKKEKNLNTIKPPRKIFGITKNTLTDNSNSGADIKSGNTLAKEVDQIKAEPGENEPLPNPTDEYLVSQMPKIKFEPQVPYPNEARSKNIEGLVLLEILIDENGKVRDAKVIEGPGYGLNESALNSIYTFVFSPALVDNKPVAVKIRYGYRFKLK